MLPCLKISPENILYTLCGILQSICNGNMSNSFLVLPDNCIALVEFILEAPFFTLTPTFE